MKRPDYQWFTLGEAARRVTISSADELSAWLTAQRQSGAALDQDAIKQIEDAFERAPERVELFTLENLEPAIYDASSVTLSPSTHERRRWAVFTLAVQWVGGSQPQGLTELELDSYLRSLRWAAAAWVIARGGDDLSLSWVGDAQDWYHVMRGRPVTVVAYVSSIRGYTSTASPGTKGASHEK